MNFELDKNLPECWEIVTIGEITLPYETEQPAKKPETEFKYIDIGSIDNSTQTITNIKTFLGKDAPSRARRIVRKDDILFSTVRTYLKNIARVPAELDGVLTSTGIAVLRCTSGIDRNFLFYSVLSDKFIRKISSTMDGTLYPAVTDTDVTSAAIVIPPLNEQHRIVAKIEALKARSQRVKEALEDIPQLLDQFRQSVLAAAFRGDLTSDWREQNPDVEPASVLLERIHAERRRRWEEAELEKMKASGKTPKDDKWKESYKEPKPIDDSDLPKLPAGWQWVNMDEIGEVSGGLTKNSQRNDLPLQFPYLRVANVYANKLEIDEIKTIGIKEEEFERVALKQGDLLVVEGNGSIDQIGRVALWDASISPCLHQNHLIKVRFNYLKIGQYIVWWLLSNNGRKQITKVASSTTGLHTLSLSKVAALPIPVAPLSEQEKIIAEIEAFFKIVENIKQQYQKTKAHLDQLDQSILAKAFRGELVPQDPNDEPASVLLERIRAERDKLQTKAAKKSTPKTGGRRSKKALQQQAEPVQLELGLE